MINIEEVLPRVKKAVGEYYQYKIKKNNTDCNKIRRKVKEKWNALEIG